MTGRKIIRRLDQMKAKAIRDWNNCPSAAAYDKGYERGYDVAIKNAIEMVREMFKNEKESEA